MRDLLTRRLPPLIGRCAAILLAATAVPESRLTAQSLTEIGKTSAGTPVMLEARSVRREGGIVTATVRVALAPPIKSADGELRSSRTVAMYDCAKRTVATRETWYFFDAAGTKEGLHRVVKTPGFGPVFKGSLADVAMTHLCKAAGAAP